MAFLTKIFGGKSSSKKSDGPSASDAIQRLRETEELLLKKQLHYENKIEEENVQIKKNVAKNKDVAMRALKRRKRLEQQLNQVEGTITTIETQREALENANTNIEVMRNLGFAAEALKKVHNTMTMDTVESVMDDIQEQQQLSDEINKLISEPFGSTNLLDDNELLKELEDMEQDFNEKLLDTTIDLPKIPTDKLPDSADVNKKEEDDLNELEAWAS